MSERNARKRTFATAGAVVCLVAVAGAATPPSSGPMIDTDFSKLPPGDMKKLAPHERITGALPAGWQDDSSWAPVWVSYRRMEDEGRGFLRMEIAKMAEGRAQLMHLIPDFADNTLFRLELTLKSPTRSGVEVGIRMRQSPYEFVWSRSLAAGTSWRDWTFDFRLNRNPQTVGLWINLGAVGSVDIARVRLVRLTREDLIAELKAKYPDGGPANLLRITRLPLGLQSGWSLDRDSSDGDDVQIAPDPNVLGPSGAPALRIRANQRFRLMGEPFAVPLVFDKHVASVYARGKGTLGLAVQGGRQAGGKGRAELSGDAWQRLTVRFVPDLLRKLYGLQLSGEGDIWIDALQVERGEEAGDYRSQLACEVALAVDSPARVQFDDEPAAVRYAVTGQAGGAVLKAKVVTPYGDSRDLPAVRLADGFLRTGTLRYDAFAGRPYGVFRVEARVEDAAGQAISPPNELVVYRLHRPRYWMKDAPNSPFGTHTNSTRRHILMAKAVGVNWTRLHDAGTQYIGWFHLEPNQGEWHFADKELKRYRTYGMKILGSFSTAPKWASHFSHEKPHNGYFDRFYQPLRMEDFAKYVRTVTGRYKDGVIDAWDVWNEPWIHAWWGVDYDETKRDRDGYLTSKDAPADFARLTATAYEAAKAVDPDCTVCGVNSTTGGGGSTSFAGDEWTRGVVAAGGLKHCDAVVYHQYTGERFGGPGDAAERGFRKAIGPAIEKAGKLDKPVWMTEGSPDPQGLGDGFYHHTLPYPADEDAAASADRLSRYVVGLLAQGVRKVFLYSMHSHGYFGQTSWRCLVTPEGYLHPSAAGLSTAAWLLEDTRFVKQVPVAEGVTAYLFEAPGRAVAVLSPMPPHAEVAPPRAEGVDVLDTWGNPLPAGAKLDRHLVYLHAKGKAAGLEKLLGK
ncbi:MAG TPA: hypothetical protein VM695_05785 [Phycisphaerae bacterium]|nr:hypothetical protein [Phycisphaerae bacterium]